ncbi:metallophosphoesterase [Streptomyces sp. NPDC015346]|uniref:metallophosphoesterase n=1 Tax=Streptomyces sp. NPDC015346 TaxID=3364954 RepID=UPI003702633F
MLVFLLGLIVVLALLGGVHWYVWRRLVRDVTARGSAARRVGTVAAFALPLLSFAALVSSRAGAPFWLQQTVAWPGYLWLALLLYVTLALAVGEAVRPLLRRWLERRPANPGPAATPGGGAPVSVPPALDGLPPAPAGLDAAVAAGTAPAGRTAVAGADSVPPHGDTLTEPTPSGPQTGTDTGLATAGATAGLTATGSDAGLATAGGEGDTARTAAGGTHTGAEAGTDARTGTGTHADVEPGTDARTGTGTHADVDARMDAGTAGASALSRRLFVSRVVGGAAAAAAVGTVGYGTYGVLRGPRVKRVTVPLAKVPRAAHGYRIAVVSDIHLGPVLGRAHTQRIVDAINATQPDLIAVVGDLVDGTVENLGTAAEPLARLRARHGSFFVTGNHEYFSGADAWVDHVRELGLRPLRNERVEIGAGFDLAGVDDIAGEREGQGPDFARALGDRDRAKATVLLAHQPVVVHDAVRHGVDLQLSGHTHGGQLWPGNYLAELANPTVAGLERYGDTQLYVSRGAGAWGPPVRVGAPSDITLVELASKQT